MALVDIQMRRLLGDGPVAQAARYHLDSGGSRTRAQLALEVGTALALPPDIRLSCACAAELLHNASLVHDDLQDNDVLRRGRPAVWREFGSAAAICTGDLMISAAYASLTDHPRIALAVRLLHEAISRTAKGQTDDLQSRMMAPQAYRAIIMQKTAPLLALPVRLALCAADAPGDAVTVQICDHLAYAYQACDDLCDRDDDRLSGRLNICLILEAAGTSPDDAAHYLACEARRALTQVRTLSDTLPFQAGTAFRRIADRLECAFMEYADAA